MKTFRFFSMLNYVMFSFFLFMLISCSDKDEDKKDEPAFRLREMTLRYINSNNPQWNNSGSMLFYYDTNNQLIAISSGGDSISLQYDSTGRISIAQYMNPEGVYNTMTYSWSGNTMTKTETVYPDRKAVFEINNEGHVIRMESYLYLSPDWYLWYYVLYNWANDNLVSTETLTVGAKSGVQQPELPRLPFFLPGLQSSYTPSELPPLLKQDFSKLSDDFFTYDNKINPFKDFQLYRYSEAAYISSANNIITSRDNNFYYTYNSANYPQVKSEFGSHWSSTATYFYELLP